MLCDYVSQHNIDFCFVQETLISSESTIKSFSSLWKGPSFWSPEIGRQGGVAVLVSDRFPGDVKSWRKDSGGRVISIQVCFNRAAFNLVNIYAPTNLTDRNSFFQSVHQFFIPHSRLIIGGDINCYDSPHDKYGGNVVVNNELAAFKTSCNLIDAWRAKHPRESQCTCRNSLLMGSVILRFYLRSY